MKKCNRCNLEKQPFDFNKNLSAKDGLRHYCRECQKQMALNYFEKKGDELKAKKKLWKLNNQDKVKESAKKKLISNTPKLKVKNPQNNIEMTQFID